MTTNFSDPPLKAMGEVFITVKNKLTGEILRHDHIKNRIMNTALNAYANILLGTTPDMEIKYFAVGSDDTAVTNSQTQLVSESFRTAIMPGTLSSTGTGEVTSEFYIIDSEAVGQIEEIGFFCGSSATSSADTGTMLSRILWSHNKTSLEEIEIIRVDTIAR